MQACFVRVTSNRCADCPKSIPAAAGNALPLATDPVNAAGAVRHRKRHRKKCALKKKGRSQMPQKEVPLAESLVVKKQER